MLDNWKNSLNERKNVIEQQYNQVCAELEKLNNLAHQLEVAIEGIRQEEDEFINALEMLQSRQRSIDPTRVPSPTPPPQQVPDRVPPLDAAPLVLPEKIEEPPAPEEKKKWGLDFSRFKGMK